MKKKLLTILIIINLGISSSFAQKQEGPITFDLTESHSIEVITEAPLVWQDEVEENVRLNITMDRFPTNSSSIEIRLIQFFTAEEGPGGIPGSSSINTTQINLEPTNRSVEIIQSLFPHESADRFYINITMIGSARGGGVSVEEDTYSFRFPQNETIVVERDNLVPVVNLYGFPSGSFFKFWLPIYATIVFLMASPGIIAGLNKLVTNFRKSEEANEISSEEELQESEEGVNHE